MPTRSLYLVRHAAYDEDPVDPVHGGTLNDVGMAQAAALGERLAKVGFTALFHSTSLRAVETADILAFSLPSLHREGTDVLRECVPARPDDAELTDSQRAFFAQLPPGVIETGAVQAREAVSRFSAVGDLDRTDLLVTHGNLINFFVAEAMGAPASGWLRPVDYHCGVTVIRYHSEVPPRVLCVNDTGHLAEDLRGVEYPPDLRW